jgi:hypothetical protein
VSVTFYFHQAVNLSRLQITSHESNEHFFCRFERVHDDVQLCQWLRTRDGTLKLGDFNRAEIMDYDIEKKEYCRYNNGHAFGNVSSSVLNTNPKHFDIVGSYYVIASKTLCM